MNVKRSLLIVGALALWLVPAASTALSHQLTVQGTLLAEDGSALSGDFDLKFTLYDASEAGKQIWTETHETVAVVGGLFDVVLGADPANALAPAFFIDNAQVWLGVQVLGGPGVPDDGDPELPRRPLTKVGAAFVADVALSADNAMKLDGMSVEDLTAAILAAVEAEGYLKPGGKLDQSNMPPNGLNEVSNDLISNQFVDKTEGNKNVPIPDNNPGGVYDELDFPDIGIAEKLTVSISVSNSDMSTVNISLFDPENTEYVLLTKGSSSGGEYATTYPEPTPTVTGDLTTWVSKNPKGKWRLRVVDTGFKDNETDGQINGWSVQIQTLSTKKIQVTGNAFFKKDVTVEGQLDIQKGGSIQGTGNIDLQGDLIIRNKAGEVMFKINHETGEVMLSKTTKFTVMGADDKPFFVIDPVNKLTTNTMFPDGSTPMLYGRIIDHTSENWIYKPKTNYAYQVPIDDQGLHQYVEQVLYGDKFGNINRDIGGGNYANQSQDLTQQVLVLFVKNTTAQAISHTVWFRWSSHSYGSNNHAGISVNQANIWNNTSNNLSSTSQALSFPANTTSVVVLKSGTYMWTTNNGTYWNKSVIAFYNNSWNLEGTGLEFDYDRYRQWVANK